MSDNIIVYQGGAGGSGSTPSGQGSYIICSGGSGDSGSTITL